MFVSKDARIVFVHVWKTGGTSIVAALQDSIGPSSKLNRPTSGQIHRREQNSLGKHAFAIDIRGEIGDDFAHFYSFAFVRNPWDWLVSWYNFVRDSKISPDTQRKWRHHLHPIVAPMDFDQFVRWVTIDDGLLNAEARKKSSFRNRTPFLQRDWVSDLDGKLIVDFVGKFETLADDFASVADRIGHPELNLPHVNRGQQASYRDYYSISTRAAVGRYFEADIEAFGYSF